MRFLVGTLANFDISFRVAKLIRLNFSRIIFSDWGPEAIVVLLFLLHYLFGNNRGQRKANLNPGLQPL